MSWFRKLTQTESEDEETGLVAAEAGNDAGDGELAIDVYQDGDDVVVKSTIAGVKPEDLDISVSNKEVSISGERKSEQEVNDDDYLYQECYWGSFSRTFSLPVEVDADRATADIKDGILTLTLPKLSRSRSKKVKVKTTDEE